MGLDATRKTPGQLRGPGMNVIGLFIVVVAASTSPYEQRDRHCAIERGRRDRGPCAAMCSPRAGA